MGLGEQGPPEVHYSEKKNQTICNFSEEICSEHLLALHCVLKLNPEVSILAGKNKKFL